MKTGFLESRPRAPSSASGRESRMPRTQIRIVSGTPSRIKGSHCSMNAVLNRKAAKRTASRMKMRTHTTASLARNENRAERASRASLMLERVEMVASADDQAPCFFVRSMPYHFFESSVSVPSSCISFMILLTSSSSGFGSAGASLSMAAASGS